MDYVIGSVAALISGNVTPNRPKIVRRALTPTKHQPSPNVTPKSEFVDDRSIFLSPSVQKKKAIVKKSPKRIFQNPDLDVTGDSEQVTSPKADKVKKHLKEELESEENMKSPKNKKIKSETDLGEVLNPQSAHENTPKKKKKRNSVTTEDNEIKPQLEELEAKIFPKKKKKLHITSDLTEPVEEQETKEKSKKKKKKKTISEEHINDNNKSNEDIDQTETPLKKKNKKHKKKHNDLENQNIQESETLTEKTDTLKKKKKKKDKNYVNPNAVTNKDTDSEHESDNEIHSENEEANKEILDMGPAQESSDEDDTPAQKQKPQKKERQEKTEEIAVDEVKRTLFVGNVLFSKKCKKEVKSIFKKYGDIETVRIRTIPVKDARTTPKLAVIKNELHPERTTVNVYIKFKDPSSVEQAISENNTVLNGCHLRVTRSDVTGAVHDPHCSVFVGNMPFALEDEGLREKFEKCGEIVSVRIIRDRKTNAGKGFGYVNFASRDGVELALALSEEDLTIKNRILRVKRCLPGGQRKDQGNKNSYGKPGNQGKQGKPFVKGYKPNWQRDEGPKDGAERRLLNKRKSQEAPEGPSEKRQRNLNQPHKEKKVKKEFVGMTAEKKKKNTYNKGQKKKRALGEILNKK